MFASSRSRQRLVRVGVIVLFAVVGLVLLRAGMAATYGVAVEAEAGTLAGAASRTNTSGASGGANVKFGGSGSGNPLLKPVGYGFMPYAYIPWGDTDMPVYGAGTGAKSFFGAFVQGSGCTPYWDGESSLGLNSSRGNTIASQINTIRAAGGDVAVSFGGAAGTELAIACSTIASTQAAYQAVITRYSLRHINFDLEGTSESNASAMARRVAAAYNLQRANPGLQVSLTIPVGTTGLISGGLNTVRQFYQAGVVISSVGIMAMDYGDNLSGAQSNRVISSSNGTINQLKSIYTGATTAEVARALNIIVMIGKNDTAETFTLNDATIVKNYAASNGIGTLSFWSASRDQPCGGANNWAEGTCSAISQSKYQFGQIFRSAY